MIYLLFFDVFYKLKKIFTNLKTLVFFFYYFLQNKFFSTVFTHLLYILQEDLLIPHIKQNLRSKNEIIVIF